MGMLLNSPHNKHSNRCWCRRSCGERSEAEEAGVKRGAISLNQS